jgi:hypothetical protein
LFSRNPVLRDTVQTIGDEPYELRLAVWSNAGLKILESDIRGVNALQDVSNILSHGF